MRVATLMIDGIVQKLPELRSWLEEERPGVVALQKTRVRDDDFPQEALSRIGYRVVSLGTGEQWAWGVAILIRDDLPPAREVVKGLQCPDVTGSRFLALDIGGLRVASVYAPYGNPGKWKKELGSSELGRERAIHLRVTWLRSLREHIHQAGYAHRDSLLCGDFNVKTKSDGPPSGDAYSEKEQDELEKLLKLGFCDLYRRLHPDPRAMPGFTFSSSCFRTTEPKGGSRLHLAIASQGLAERLISASVDMDANIRPKARPLVVEFANPDQ